MLKPQFNKINPKNFKTSVLCQKCANTASMLSAFQNHAPPMAAGMALGDIVRFAEDSVFLIYAYPDDDETQVPYIILARKGNHPWSMWDAASPFAKTLIALSNPLHTANDWGKHFIARNKELGNIVRSQVTGIVHGDFHRRIAFGSKADFNEQHMQSPEMYSYLFNSVQFNWKSFMVAAKRNVAHRAAFRIDNVRPWRTESEATPDGNMQLSPSMTFTFETPEGTGAFVDSATMQAIEKLQEKLQIMKEERQIEKVYKTHHIYNQ